MDNSLTLARHFARLVWLLIHESQSTDDQKLALRAVVYTSKAASVRLGNTDGRLGVNGLVMPQALSGVQELVERLGQHSIEEILIEQGAAPAELLSLARLLAVGVVSTSDMADFAQKLSELNGRTVHIRLAERTAPSPARTNVVEADAAAPAPEGDRVHQLHARLAEAPNAAAAQQGLDELAFLAEQATREGRTGDTADTFTALLDFEARAVDPEIRRAYVVTARRLTRPTLLRPIAHLLTSEPARAAQTERILQRCGQDGVDAVVDQYASAATNAQRRVYREVLFRLTAARDSLVSMLSDSRWYIVRQAAAFLGEMAFVDVDRPLAELLRHQDERVRRAATRALARIDTPFALDALARALLDDAPTVRLEAIAALTTRRGARVGAMLAQAIDQEAEGEVQFAILAALGRVATPDAVQKLVTAAAAASGLFKSKKNSSLRVAAVLALGDARTPGALSALQALTADREKEVRDAVARTLAGTLKGSAA